MKIKFTIIIILLITISSIFAGATVEQLQASSENENVKLTWTSIEEVNLNNYIIERRTPQSDFVEIGTVKAEGNNIFYSYIDRSAYKTTGLIFIYRLKIVDNNQQVSHSKEVSVSSNVSGVKRTWGSIKAMFR